MSYIVTKPFKTPTRRLSAGDEIDAADLDGPLTADDWVDLGFLEPAPARVIEYPNEQTPVFDPRAPLADDPPN